MVATEDSILQTTKKNLGIDASYDAFDLDVITHINAAIATLGDLGVGPTDGLEVTGEDEVWSDLIIDTDLRSSRVKSYIYLHVRRAFDPPGTGFLSTSIDNQINELVWRISAQREEAI